MPNVTALGVAIYVTALGQPGPYYPPGRCPETDQERALRMATIAIAIDFETHDADHWAEGFAREDWAWMGYTKTRLESRRFAVEVHDGTARGDGGVSVCLGQIYGGGAELVGIDLAATRRCYREVFRYLQLHQVRCNVWKPTPTGVAIVFAGYGTGSSCNADHVSPVLGAGWARRRANAWAHLRTRP